MESRRAADRVGQFWGAEAWRMLVELAAMTDLPLYRVCEYTGRRQRAHRTFAERPNRGAGLCGYWAVRGLWWDWYHSGRVSRKPWAPPQEPGHD